MDRSRFPLDHISLSTIRIFVAVVEAQGFTAAARQSKVSVSSVSKAIASLERAVGTALLFRTTRSVSVTEVGRRFYTRCMGVLAELDDAASTAGRGLMGHLRVSAPPSVTSEILAKAITRFIAAHPGLSVDMFVTSSLPDIVRDRIDVAFVLREWPEVKMAYRDVARLDRVLCASPHYLRRNGRPEMINDLYSHACLSSIISGMPEPWTFLTPEGKTVVQVNATFSSDNGDIIRQACIDGVGIANLYAFHAAKSLARGDLVQILGHVEQEKVKLYAMLPHRDLVRSQASAFIDFVHDLFHDEAAS